jgi:hypothetical protein
MALPEISHPKLSVSVDVGALGFTSLRISLQAFVALVAGLLAQGALEV